MFAFTLVSTYYLAGATLAVLGVLTVVYKGVSAFETTKRAVTQITYEFSPNGGRSMRDQVDSIKTEQQAVKLALVTSEGERHVDRQRIADHILADGAAFQQQAQTNQRIEQTLQKVEEHLRKGTP